MAGTTEAVAAAKRAAGYQAAGMVEDEMVIGLGTGSTVLYMIERLSGRVRDGLSVSGVPTSYQTAMKAREYGIPLTTLDDNPVLDLAIDGADQIDPQLRMIKGRGAALTREKCVAAAAFRFIVVADDTKMVSRLSGVVPVETIPFATKTAMGQLRGLGCRPFIREAVKKDGPVITDNGNFIVDCQFDEIADPAALEAALAMIPGVVESGLFTRFSKNTTVIIGNEKKCKVLTSADVVP
ncbi:ribose-5-phosphate isomerase RpiA [Methanoregula sp.]|jgi:ribose 5-phosphate isomerase A|uniref:ribose-5-phosphate isomerase RpiA n=1 Tax=Methanoregula sp. TaxID=2052170 RepID=UPI0025FBB962|nr:ribose-5-phosphate isomerase RpiA [Methanoregula sp.]